MDKELTLMICCHNHGKYLPRMLEDVFAQTISSDRWKLLILFDACTDHSEWIFRDAWNDLCTVQGKAKNWLECIKICKEEKKGLANAKNRVLKYVDTPYVAYLDADDGMFPERLERQLNLLKKYTMGQMDVCACQAWDRDEHGRLFINCFKIGQYEYHDNIERAIQRENVICHGSVMARIEAIRDVDGYSESKNILGREDYDLWLRMMAAGKKFYTIPERLYIWSMNTSTER